MKTYKNLAALLVAGLAFIPACAQEGDGDNSGSGNECTGAKCDTPSGEQDQQCLDRQSEVLSSSNAAFTVDAIRWSCADVEGVNAKNRDDRGQEYCEYFALFQPPPAEEGAEERPEAVDLGRPLDRNGNVSNLTICVDEDGDGEDDDGRGSDECRVMINEDQLIYLEDHPSEVVGQCVFTSWHADIDVPVKNCLAEDGSEDCSLDAAIYNFPLTIENFRMKISFNSNRAAADLVERCYQPGVAQDQAPEDWKNAEDPLTEPFFRGCMEVQNHFGTGWRRSDPSVCAVANRLRECECTVPGVTTAKQLGDAIVPLQPSAEEVARGDAEVTLRGFRLASWTSPTELSPGCRYANTGEETQALVLCDLTANDVFATLNDPKEACRATYGANVVVHVPIPAAAITCNPDGSKPEHAGCGDKSWVIGDEGIATEPDPDAEEPKEPPPVEPEPEAAGNCCEEGTEGRTGCENSAIESCVCAADSFCCNNAWDAQCRDQVTALNCGDCPSTRG